MDTARYSLTTRALVTGGAGFLGSHLCDRLMKNLGASSEVSSFARNWIVWHVPYPDKFRTRPFLRKPQDLPEQVRGMDHAFQIKEEFDVICLDNFFTGQKRNIAHLIGNPYFELIRHDVTFPYYAEVDQIYNFACPASPPHYQHDPVQTTKTSVHGAINMLGLAKRTGARILQASTSEVYGDPLVHPQVESYWGNVNPIGIRSCYDEGKRCAETLFFDYYRQNQVEVKVVRIFNTYGPRMHPNDGRVVSNFIVQALRGEDITIYGDGGQTRSFCYVDDLIGAIILMMRSRAGFTGPVNIGNPCEFSIRELAEKILSLTGSPSKLIFRPLPQDDPKQRRPDISLAESELNWAPRVTLEDGLRETIAYFKRLAARRMFCHILFP